MIPLASGNKTRQSNGFGCLHYLGHSKDTMNLGQDFSLSRILMRITRSPAIKTLLLSAFVYALIFQYCRIRFWRDPHSAFFDISNVYDWQYSLTREHEAHHFISYYKTIEKNEEKDHPQSKDILKSSDEPLLCAAFVTVKRDLDDYFEGAIGSMLQGLDARERHALHLKVIFANTDPKKHPGWGQPWLDEVIDSVETYDVPESTFKELEKLEAEEDFRTKGVLLVFHCCSCILLLNSTEGH